MVKLKEPPAVGVPLSTPSDDNVRPAGSEPLVVVNVNGPVPPVVVIAWVYGKPTVVTGKVLGSRAKSITLSEQVSLPLKPLESVTETVKVAGPITVGVPLSTPSDDSVRPAGNVSLVEYV